MTPKQIERIKIKRIKAKLAADKKHWGGYNNDGSGLRYFPPDLYVQITDYTGGLRYITGLIKTFLMIVLMQNSFLSVQLLCLKQKD